MQCAPLAFWLVPSHRVRQRPPGTGHPASSLSQHEPATGNALCHAFPCLARLSTHATLQVLPMRAAAGTSRLPGSRLVGSSTTCPTAAGRSGARRGPQPDRPEKAASLDGLTTGCALPIVTEKSRGTHSLSGGRDRLAPLAVLRIKGREVTCCWRSGQAMSDQLSPPNRACSAFRSQNGCIAWRSMLSGGLTAAWDSPSEWIFCQHD